MFYDVKYGNLKEVPSDNTGIVAWIRVGLIPM
jgi:hypothetical protein